jgi:hypothetical protein
MQLKSDTAPFDGRNETDHPTATSESHIPGDDGLLHTAGPIMIAIYAAALGIATITFWQSGDTLLFIAICAVYLAMVFGMATLMYRIRNTRDDRWSHTRPKLPSSDVTVLTGKLGRTEALLQILTVPFVVVFAFAAFAIIWTTVGS